MLQASSRVGHAARLGLRPAGCSPRRVIVDVQASVEQQRPQSTNSPACSSSSGRRSLLIGAAAAPLVLPPTQLLMHTAANAAPLVLPPPAGAIPAAELAAGLSISRIVKGCWQLSGGHRGDSETDRTSGQAAVDDFQTFVDAGITTFDCADHYGPAETLIGKFLAKGGPELRKRVQVLTKVCLFDGLEMAALNKSIIAKAVATRNQRLGTTADCVQYYWGAYDFPRYVDGAKYLADEQAAGHFGHLGVTNFDVARVSEMTDRGRVPVEANQIQFSMLDRRPLNGMVQFCEERGIKLLPYGVLAGGLLSAKYLGVPAGSVLLNTSSKRKYAQVVQQAGGWEWFQSLLQALDGVAKRNSTTISNVATRWVLDQPQVAGVAVGARNAAHVREFGDVFSFQLDDQDRGVLQEVLDAGLQARGDCYQFERGLGPW